MKAIKSKKCPCMYHLVFDNGIQQYNVSRNLWEVFKNSELVKATWSND
ncbi:hypothetical protein [Rickettsia akari]|nr:hypothetical protein [Rickettsia akari]